MPQPLIVACPGTLWCSRGLVDTRAMAEAIRRDLSNLNPQTLVCISGCPNGCAHSSVADIGLIGAMSLADGVKTEAYRICTSGDHGRSNSLAKPAGLAVPASAITEALRLQYLHINSTRGQGR